MTVASDFSQAGVAGVPAQGSDGMSGHFDVGIPNDMGQAAQSQVDFEGMAPSMPDETLPVDEATLAQLKAQQWMSPEDWRNFQSIKDREVGQARRQVLEHQQRAQAAELVASEWENAVKAYFEEMGDTDRFEVLRARITNKVGDTQKELGTRQEQALNYIQSTLNEASAYVALYSADPNGNTLFQKDDPEIKQALQKVAAAARNVAVQQSPQAEQAETQAIKQFQAVVARKVQQGYQRLAGYSTAQANRQRQQERGPMVTANTGSGGGAGQSPKALRDALKQAHPDWDDQRIFSAVMDQLVSQAS